jgi:class 3 adenylate cyclase
MGKTERRLAAVVAADVVGFSRMMGRNEDDTLGLIRWVTSDVIEPSARLEGGRLVKTTGDGFLLDFPTVAQAFRFALSVQEQLAVRDVPHAKGNKLCMRIGINIGDIIFEDDDIFGDGVNIAARIEGLSEPGGVAVSSRAHDDLRRLGFKFTSIGQKKLKNIDHPIEIFLFRNQNGRKGLLSRLRYSRYYAPTLKWAAAVVLVLCTALVILSYRAWKKSRDPGVIMAKALTAEPCSWLRLSSVAQAEDGTAISGTVAGVSGLEPAIIRDHLEKALRAINIGSANIDVFHELRTLTPGQCPTIENIARYRYGGATRQYIFGSWGRNMLSGASPAHQSLSFAWQPDGYYKRYVYVISVHADGKLTPLLGADLRKPHKGYYDSAVDVGQSGLYGVIVMESDRPEPLIEVADSLTLPGADFDVLANRDGWRFDTIWHQMAGPTLTAPIR